MGSTGQLWGLNGGRCPASLLTSRAQPPYGGEILRRCGPGGGGSAVTDGIAVRLGPALTGNVAGITRALNDRDWSCSEMRFLGGGTNPNGTFYVYVMRGEDETEQWWVFTVVDEKVVAIE